MLKNRIKYGKIRTLKFNRKRHELLKLISRNRIGTEVKEDDFVNNNLIAVSFKEILSSLNINEHERFVITSELFENEEIKYFNNRFDGVLATRKGVASYFSGKYLKIDSDKNRENIKFYFSIIATIMSLFIAGIAVSINLLKEQKDKQEQAIEIETRIQSLETDIKNLKPIP